MWERFIFYSVIWSPSIIFPFPYLLSNSIFHAWMKSVPSRAIHCRCSCLSAIAQCVLFKKKKKKITKLEHPHTPPHPPTPPPIHMHYIIRGTSAMSLVFVQISAYRFIIKTDRKKKKKQFFFFHFVGEVRHHHTVGTKDMHIVKSCK